MAKVFFLICALVLFIGILKTNGATKLILFFIGIIFFPSKIVLFDTPTLMSFTRLMIYALFLAELMHPKEFYKELKNFPLIKPLMIVFIGIMCIGLFDSRHSFGLNFYRTFDEYMQTFFVIFLCYTNFKINSEWKQIFTFILVASGILCLFGIYVFITKSNPYDSLIKNTYNGLSDFDFYVDDPGITRFRINSFVSHPIFYGYLLGVFLLFTFCHFLFKGRKAIYFIAMALLLTNLILTNSRTPFISTFLGLVVFILIALGKRAKIKFAIYGFIACFALYSIPALQKTVNESLDVFETGGQKTGGSSVKMRQMQLNASLKQFKKSAILGNGLYYIEENLGYINASSATADSEFQGFESYVYELLIEQGIVGIVINVIFFVSLLIYFLRHMSTSRQFAGLGFSIVIMFLFFIIGTGPLGSWVISMALLGILIATLNNTVNLNAALQHMFNKSTITQKIN